MLDRNTKAHSYIIRQLRQKEAKRKENAYAQRRLLLLVIFFIVGFVIGFNGRLL